jgi:hypothetical protein
VRVLRPLRAKPIAITSMLMKRSGVSFVKFRFAPSRASIVRATLDCCAPMALAVAPAAIASRSSCAVSSMPDG